MASGDVSFELPVTVIKGAVFEPEALGHPGMPLVDPKKPIPLDKQRALVVSAKDPVLKQAQAAILATMLYRQSKLDKVKEKDLLTEARQVLRDVAQEAGDKAVDEITLRLLGSYELLLEDYPAAEKAWQALLDKDPKSKEAPIDRTWLAYAQLKQFKNTEALASVGADKPDDKQPELAYVAAWAKLRTGDGDGAWQAINAAVRGWGQNVNRDDLVREVLQFAGRASIPLDQAFTSITTVLAKAKPQQYELLAKLGLSGGYGLVGRWSDAIAALDKAIDLGGDTVPPSNRLVIRSSQVDFAVPLDNPDAAVKYGKLAIEAVKKSCDAKCSDRDKVDTIQDVYLTGRLFHTLYATANDRRYYQPAHDLYELTIPLIADPTAQGSAQRDARTLETTLKNIKPGTGTHDKGALASLLARHNSELQGCYEAGLGANPKLGGTIAISLESDATGEIKGLSTEPKAGLTELSAVAGCVANHVKQWKLPKRGMAGTTRIKLSYTFAVKK